jgi:outer membrane cobalamin receptor
MRILSFIFLYTSLLYTYTFAQQVADTLELGEVDVQASRIYVAEGYQPVSISGIDSARIRSFSTGNISELLESFAPVHVRSNGPGGLATASQRGYSPSQTQVLWNGFQLNHAMLGLTDLSLIPSFAVEQVSISSGNGNTSFGDRGGGTVAFRTRQQQNEVGVSQAIGAFGQSITEAQAGITFGKWSLGVITGYENSANDFDYSAREFSNEAGGIVEVQKKRENNKLEAKTGILSASWRGKDQMFSTVIWAHDMYNEIPGSINGRTPQAYQEDAFLRWMSQYSRRISNHKLTGKLYFNRQQLDFINPANSIHSLSTSATLMGDVELRSTLNPELQLISALQFGQSWVEATDYSGFPQRSQFTAQINPIWHLLDPVHLYGGFRLDYYSDFEEAYSANAGFNVEVVDDLLYLKGQLSRNYIAPTFNDLYWPDLGDPDLKAETNLKYEAGILIEHDWSIARNSFEITYYDGNIEDGIRWLPGSDGRFRPQNLEELRLWGFEVKEEIMLNVQEFTLSLQGMLLHTQAEITQPRFDGDQAVGKQLRYTPEWQVKASAVFAWRDLSALFSYNFTDERFSSADHSSPFDPLPDYEQSAFGASYNLIYKNHRIRPQFSIQNLFDEEYSVIQGYPMPGRSTQFKLSINYKLN